MGLNLWGWINRAKQGQPPVPAGCARLDETLLLGLIERVSALTTGLKEISTVAAGIGREGELLADQVLNLHGRTVPVEDSAERVQQIARYTHYLSGSAHKQNSSLLEAGRHLGESAACATGVAQLVAEANAQAGGIAQLKQAAVLLSELCEALSATNERIAGAGREAEQSSTVLDHLATTLGQTLMTVQQTDGVGTECSTVELAKAVRHKARASVQIAVTATALATDAVELKRLLDALASEGTAATLP